MEIINSIFTWVMKKRMHQIELFLKYPIEVQDELFQKLIESARDTRFAKGGSEGPPMWSGTWTIAFQSATQLWI